MRSTTHPFDRAARTWEAWSQDVDTTAADLDVDVLFDGLSGDGIDQIADTVRGLKATAQTVAMMASELSTECSTQALYDRDLTAAPTVHEVAAAEKAADEVRLRYRYGSSVRPGDREILDDAVRLRQERDRAVEQHATDTETTTLTTPPSGLHLLPGTEPNPHPNPHHAAGGLRLLPGHEPYTPEAPRDRETSHGGTEPSSTPYAAQFSPQQPAQPQQSTSTPTPTPTPSWSPSSFAPTAHGTSTDLYSRDGTDTDPDTEGTEAGTGTSLSSDHLNPGGGGVVHGTTTSDTSGKGTNPYAVQPQQNPNLNAANHNPRMGMGGGMMPMGMGGMGGRAGQRPEVLSDDPQGKRGDEFAFEGGLIGHQELSEEEAAEEWFRKGMERGPSHDELNPHLSAR